MFLGRGVGEGAGGEGRGSALVLCVGREMSAGGLHGLYGMAWSALATISSRNLRSFS